MPIGNTRGERNAISVAKSSAGDVGVLPVGKRPGDGAIALGFAVPVPVGSGVGVVVLVAVGVKVAVWVGTRVGA
jgi:hypothetical protein